MIRNILIIEHNKAFCDILLPKLTAEGDVVSVVHDGREGLVQAQVSKPDVIVLNENLPKISGKEILEKLSLDSQTKNIPKIYITNTSDEQELQKLYEYGVRHIFPRTGYDHANVADAMRRAIKFPDAFAMEKPGKLS